MEMEIVLAPCPACGSIYLSDDYVYIKCKDCGVQGPWTNGGKFDDHADWIDHENAIERWNKMPRAISVAKDLDTSRYDSFYSKIVVKKETGSSPMKYVVIQSVNFGTISSNKPTFNVLVLNTGDQGSCFIEDLISDPVSWESVERSRIEFEIKKSEKVRDQFIES
jgi:hypothetical protein